MILPASFFDTTPYFGLSFSQSSIKAVSVSRDGKILSFAQQPISPTDLDQEKSDSSQLISSLEQIKTQGNFQTPYVSVVLPETFAFSKEFTLPSVNESELAEAISWQIGDIFPLSEDEIYTDWKLLSKTKESTTALVVAIPKKRIDSLRAALAKVGLFPISFEPSVSSLSRTTSLKANEFVVLIDVNAHDNSISLIENGVSLISTTNIVSDESENLISKIKSSIDSLFSYYKDKKTTIPKSVQIILTGDRAEQNFAKMLESTINIPTTLLEVNGINPGFHQAYTGAISQIQPPEDQQSINLLPKDLQNWYQDHHALYLQKKALKYQLITFALIIIITTANLMYLSSINSRYKIPTIPSNSTNTSNITQITNKANRINALFSQKVSPQEEIQEALLLVPNTIKIESISYEDSKKEFQFIGIAQNREDLIEFKNKLNESPLFSNIDLPIGVLTQKENVSFSIKFVVSSPNK